MIYTIAKQDWTGNHTLGDEYDFTYELKEDKPTHQIFNIIDGNIS